MLLFKKNASCICNKKKGIARMADKKGSLRHWGSRTSVKGVQMYKGGFALLI